MPTIPIYLEVEDERIGPTMRMLKKWPGVIKMLVDPGEPEKPKRLPKPEQEHHVGRGANGQEMITALLIKHNGGPLHLDQIQKETRLKRQSIYGALTQLKSKGVVGKAGSALWQFSPKAKKALLNNGDAHAIKLLPPPRAAAAKANGHAIKRGPKGRLGKGVAREILLTALAVEDLSRTDLATKLVAGGMKPNAVQGALSRGREDGLITKVGTSNMFALTPQGKKAHTELGA